MLLFLPVVQSRSRVWLFVPPWTVAGLPVLHHLLEFAQAHVLSVVPLSSCLQSFPASGSFPMIWLFISGGQSTGALASVSVLPMNIQGWFPLGWTGLISLQSKALKSLLQPQFKSINSLLLSLLYGPTLTSIHDYWKNHSFDYMDLCQQSDVSAF